MAGESSEISVVESVQAYPVPQADPTVFIFHFSSTGDLLIEDGKKNIIFTANPYPSKHKEIALLDSKNEIIYLMSKKMISPYCKWKGYRGVSTNDSDLVYIMKKEHIYQSATNLVVLMPNKKSGKQECVFKINGSWSKGTFRVYKGCLLIAEMKSMDVKDKFKVTINPAEDTAFVVSLFVTIQAMKISPDKNHHHGIGVRDVVGGTATCFHAIWEVWEAFCQ